WAHDGLWWDPIRPLTGLGDWLERVIWRGDAQAAAGRSARSAQALRWFREGQNGSAVLKNVYWGNPSRRLELVEDLLNAMPRGTPDTRHDPALRALLDRERKRLALLVEQGLSAGEMRTAFKRLKRPLYPYQREGVQRFLATGHLLLADD